VKRRIRLVGQEVRRHPVRPRKVPFKNYKQHQDNDFYLINALKNI
jgi:hypothetical protein